MEFPTPYHEVNLLLDDLLRQVRAVLGAAFAGLYLYGSLAMGDFDPRRSDVDFVVVTHGFLQPETIRRLEEMHRELAASQHPWAKKLEGQYVPLAELRRYNPDGPALPTINEGHFFLAGQGSDWIIQRYILREHEAIVAGSSLRPFIDPVGPEEIRDAARAVLVEWWAPMAEDPSWLADRPDYQAFAVQTMCRILAAMETGEVLSKSAACHRAAQHLEEPWSTLAQEAIAWTPDQPPLGTDRPAAFIGYVTGVVAEGKEQKADGSVQ